MPRIRSNFGVIGSERIISSNSSGFLASLVEHQVKSSTSSWPGRGIPLEILIVAGGGAGGVSIGAGGGAGGVLIGTFNAILGTTYNITIGAGGATGADGTNGANTQFGSIIAFGGGGGRTWTTTNGANAGNNGGSGAGGAGNRGGTSAGGIYTQTSQGGLIGYGNNGGTGRAAGDPIQPAGGGGAGGVGQDGINTGTTKAGDGGIGIYNNFQTGSNIGYAGGGSGFSYNSGANPTDTRDTWGGGVSISDIKVPGVINRGGGGGGGGFTSGPNQGSGGSGVVIFRYPTTTYGLLTSTTGSPTVSTYGSFRVYTFTGSGSITI